MRHPTEDRAFRLDPGIRPLRYDARLSVDLAGRAFSGELTLALSLAREASELVLHAAGLRLTRCACEVGGRLLEGSATPVAASETVRLAFPAALPAGRAELRLAWTGRFTDGLRGLYLAGPELAATQFEAADARRVFPCLDEPGFKAPWRLAVEIPSDLEALSNGAAESSEARGATRVVQFAETPPLPAYLVALVVGRIEAGATGAIGAIPVRSWAATGKGGLAAWGQEVALAALPRLEDYFGLPYAFGKLDQVALPDFGAGAMENAGLVTYREVALLLDPATASLAQRKRVAEVVTHELAHQWFGNLVTMRWWDDLWLNEAFATWMAYLVVDGWRPGWRLWLDFDQGKAAAMALDALHATHPIRAEVRTVGEATESFDLITYEKGGGVLRMIERYLGADRFREGIRRYMRRHARDNAVAADLWRALGEASGEPVEELAAAWIDRPGFPVVDAELVGATLRLSQRRFLSRPGDEDPGARWPIPIVLRLGRAGRVEERRLLLREGAVALPLGAAPDWVVVNAGATGFYRVAPGPALLGALAGHLEDLAPPERVALLSDGWALVRRGERGIGDLLDLCEAFSRETDRVVLDELVGLLATLERRLVPEDDRPRLAAWVRELLGERFSAAGWDPAPGEDDEPRLARAALLRAVGLVARSPAVAAEAAARLDRFVGGDRGAVEANLHDAVVAIVARGGDARRFEAHLAAFQRERDPAFRRRWLLSLAAFEEPALVERAIALLLGDGVPLQDWASFAASLLGNRAARAPLWRRLQEDWAAVEARLGGAPMLLRRVVEAVGLLVRREELDEARALFARHPVEPARAAVAQTLERLSEDVDLAARTGPEIARWLAGRGGR